MSLASAAPSDSLARQSLRTFLSDRFGVLFGIIFIGFVLLAIFAPWIAPHDPNASSLLRRLQPPGWMKGGALS